MELKTKAHKDRICRCEIESYARGLCFPCYKRAWRGHDPLPPTTRRENGTGNISKAGYKRVMWKGKLVLEHRLLWELVFGLLPQGWIVHHIDGDRLGPHFVAMPRADHMKFFHDLVENLGDYARRKQ